MSSVSITPTLTSSSGTIVITVTATVTSSTVPAPELFVKSFWGCLTCLDILLVFTGVWTALIVGLNRLSGIPIIVPMGAAIGNGLLFIVTREQTAGRSIWHPFNFLMMNVAFAVQHYGANFYTFFILKLLLSRSGKTRRTFLWGFWVLLLGHIGISCISATTTALVWKGTTDERIKKIEKSVYPPSFMVLASLEIWGAGFLLYTLYVQRRKTRRLSGTIHLSQRVGLLRQLAQSTEIRLATLASVGIIRAGTGWTWYAVPSPSINVTVQIDNFAVLMENVYPVLLIIDLLAARINGGSSSNAGSHNRAQAPIPGEAIRLQPVAHGRGRRPSRVAQTIDTIKRDFGQYLGRSYLSRKEEDAAGQRRTDTSNSKSLGSSKLSSAEDSKWADETAKGRIDEYTRQIV